jgi:hypothetical protein
MERLEVGRNANTGRKEMSEKYNYKKLYYEELIDQLVDKRFTGWLFLSVFSLATIAVWIFGTKEFWSFNNKLFWTGVAIVIVVVMGYFPIKNSNKLIKMYRKEIENER